MLNLDTRQGEVILQEMSTAATQPRQSIKKKEKQQLKHEAFIESTLYISNYHFSSHPVFQN